MLSLARVRSLLGLLLVAGVVLLYGAPRGHARAASKNVTFKTFDGVELSGTFYPNFGGKRDATVILLHDFDPKSASSQQEGWSDLAVALQKDGYAVLSFDFRGYGDSKNVNKDVFWKNIVNKKEVRHKGKTLPDQIDSKDFSVGYMKYLVNDIAAAKAYLDRQNDQKACNTSSMIVIGAGEGATLGAMWMAHECRRRKDKFPNPIVGVTAPVLGEPESKDLAAGVFLGISPVLNKKGVTTPMRLWLMEVGQTAKVPLAFVHGKDDAQGDTLASGLAKAVKPNPKGKDLPHTLASPIAKTKLQGHKLLDPTLSTRDWLLKTYLPGVMEARGNKEWVERKVGTSAFWYTRAKASEPFKVNKKPDEDIPAVDVGMFIQ